VWSNGTAEIVFVRVVAQEEYKDVNLELNRGKSEAWKCMIMDVQDGV